MLIHFQEPTSPRYIYINPDNNQIHLMMPVVSGEQIGLDNTCKSLYALQEFFGKNSEAASKKQSALDELIRYKNALLFDTGLLPDGHELKTIKQQRLKQIDSYINVINTIRNSAEMSAIVDRAFESAKYPDALKTMMKNSNLYSILLRPKQTDPIIHAVNPIFSVIGDRPFERGQTEVFYPALKNAFQPHQLNLLTPRDRLKKAVLDSQEHHTLNFENIQSELTEQFYTLFEINVDFNHTHDGKQINEQSMKALAPFQDSITAEDYVDSLLFSCCPDTLWENIPCNFFYRLENNDAGMDKLSLLTQFFLAQINIHCFSKGISTDNFGKKLDASSELSIALAETVVNTLKQEAAVEDALCLFVNDHAASFGLKVPLSSADISAIEEEFRMQFTMIKDSPHFDEFIMLNPSKLGQFITHQSCICTDLSAFIAEGYPSLDNEFFQKVNADFRTIIESHNGIIPHINDIGPRNIQLSVEQVAMSIINTKTFALTYKHLTENDQAALVTELGNNGIASLINDIEDLTELLPLLPAEHHTAVITTLGSRGIVSIVQNLHDLISVLPQFPERTWSILFTTLGSDGIRSLTNSTSDLKRGLSQLPPNTQMTLLTTLGIEGVASLIKKTSDLREILPWLPTETHAPILTTLGIRNIAPLIENAFDLISVLPLLPAETQAELITTLGIERIAPFIKKTVDLTRLLSQLPEETQPLVIATLDIKNIASLIKDSSELIQILTRLPIETQSELITTLGIEGIASLIKETDSLTRQLSRLPEETRNSLLAVIRAKNAVSPNENLVPNQDPARNNQARIREELQTLKSDTDNSTLENQNPANR